MSANHPLTPRQLEAVALYAQGLRAPEIAERMVISPKTLSQHLESAKERMKARTLAHLMFMLGREVQEA